MSLVQLLSNFRKDDLSIINADSNGYLGHKKQNIGNSGFNSVLAKIQKDTDLFFKEKASVETLNDAKPRAEKQISQKPVKDKTLESFNNDPVNEKFKKVESVKTNENSKLEKSNDKPKVSGLSKSNLKSRIENLSKKLKEKLKNEDLDSETEEDILELLDLFTQVNPDQMPEKSINKIEKALKDIDNLLSKKEVGNQINLTQIKDYFSSNKEIKKILDDLKNLMKKSSVDSEKTKNGFKKNLAESAKDSIDLEVKDLRVNDLSKLNKNKLIVKSSSKRTSSNSKAKPDAEFILKTEMEVSSKNNVSTGQNNNNAFGSDLKDSGKLYKGMKEFSRKTGVKQPRKIFNQIVERARVTLKSGMSEMKLQIKPRFLGRIKMQLMLKNGSLSAKLSIGNEGLRSFLQQNLQDLSSELHDAGIDIKQMEIVNDQSTSGKKNSDDSKDNRFSKNGFLDNNQLQKKEVPIYSGVSHHSGKVNLIA